MTDSKVLNLRSAFVVFAGFAGFMTIVVVAGTSISNARKEQVRDLYAQETKQWIAQNRSGVEHIFQLFPAKECYTYNTYPNPNTQPPCPSQNEIALATDQNLKDWSSTAFIKESEGKVLEMDLSGATREFYLSDVKKREDVKNLLAGKVETIPWDSYTYQLGRKQVIVPVKDTSGKIIGAIVRGVIEPSIR